MLRAENIEGFSHHHGSRSHKNMELDSTRVWYDPHLLDKETITTTTRIPSSHLSQLLGLCQRTWTTRVNKKQPALSSLHCKALLLRTLIKLLYLILRTNKLWPFINIQHDEMYVCFNRVATFVLQVVSYCLISKSKYTHIRPVSV